MRWFGFSQMTISQIIFIKNKISRGNFDLVDLEKSKSPICKINAFRYTTIDNSDKKRCWQSILHSCLQTTTTTKIAKYFDSGFRSTRLTALTFKCLT